MQEALNKITPELKSAIDSLLEYLECFEQECCDALKVGYSIPYARGEGIEIQADDLRRLKSCFTATRADRSHSSYS